MKDNSKVGIILVHLMDPIKPAKGGAIRYTLNILKYMLSKGYNILFVGTQSLEKTSFDTNIANFLKEGLLKILYISSTGNLIRFISKLFLVSMKDFDKYHIIHAQRTWFSIPFIIRGFSKRKRIITTVHAPPLETLRSSNPLLASLLYPLYMLVEYLSFIFSHAIIFVSRSLMEYYRLTQRMKKKSIVIPGGTVDINMFTPSSMEEREHLRKKLGFKNNDVVIISVGRLEKVKRVHLLIESIRIIIEKKGIKNVKAIIVGDGTQRSILEDMVRRYHLEENIIFTGNIPPEKVVEYYRASDILCLTSLAEASPNVIKEALAVGIPFIATNVSDEIQELASLGVGLVVPKNVSAEQLAEAITIFSRYVKKKGDILKNKCRRLAELYDINRVMRYIEKLYHYIQ